MKKNKKSLPVKFRPFVYNKPSIVQVSWQLLILLLLQIIALFITKSYNSILIIACTVLGTVLSGVANLFFFRKKDFSFITIICQGIMIGMLLPSGFPPFTAFSLTFFVMLVAKHITTDGMNTWINLVCIAVVIAWFIGRSFFPSFIVTGDMFALKNPSVSLIQNGVFPVYPIDSSITSFLNRNIFAPLNVTLPEGMISILIDTKSVIPAFRFNLLTIIASIVLFSCESFSLMIPSVFLFVYALLVRLFFPFVAGGAFNQGDIFLTMCTNGTLFTAVFLLQWFGSHPMTYVGNLLYGVFAGIAAFFLAGCGTSSVGMVYTVLFCNLLNLIIRIIEEKQTEKYIAKLTGATLAKEAAK